MCRIFDSQKICFELVDVSDARLRGERREMREERNEEKRETKCEELGVRS